MQRIGFLTDLVAPDELDARIGKMTERLTALAPRALEETKRAINAISRGDFDLNDFKLREASLLRSSDLREGLAATREKRVPNFTGK
jgi:1,4-dihydroxy-2-naphthoyl-CoA synthase